MKVGRMSRRIILTTERQDTMTTQQAIKVNALDCGDICIVDGKKYVCVADATQHPTCGATLRPYDAAIGDDSGDIDIAADATVIWEQPDALSGWTMIDAD